MNSTPKVASSEKMMSEWDFEINDQRKLDPYSLSLGSGYIAGWICPKGHKYDASINSRKRGSGCPYCCNKKALRGFNDFGTKYPEIAKEWHPTKNGDSTPYDFTYGSGQKAWWICPFKHEYQMCLRDSGRGVGCSVCARALKTSFPEQAVFYYVKKGFPDAISGYKDCFNNGMELDIYIPSLKIGIEYDGSAYHGQKRMVQDNIKYSLCQEKGIQLIRIMESSYYAQFRLYHRKIEIPKASDEYLNYAINLLCYKLEKPQDVDVNRDRFEIQAYLGARRTSLKDEYPEIASEWDYERNGGLLPEQFTAHSNDKVFWKCKRCGKSWKARISERTRKDSKGTGCPDCNAKNGVLKQIEMRLEENGSLAEVYPNLMKEWDFERNTIDPYAVLPSSTQKAWWICSKCGYKWSTKIANRTGAKCHGCRLCSKQDTVKGINDISTTRPDLLKEWNYKKNTKSPEEFSEHSNQIVWWECSVCGHEWEAAINMRARGHGCPCCSGRVPKAGVNDLKTLRPDVAKDWDYNKNEKGPESYKVNSHAVVWWKCSECGYEWEKMIRNRTRFPSCPNCK